MERLQFMNYQAHSHGKRGVSLQMAGVKAESANGRKENTKREWHRMVEKYSHFFFLSIFTIFKIPFSGIFIQWASTFDNLFFSIPNIY